MCNQRLSGVVRTGRDFRIPRGEGLQQWFLFDPQELHIPSQCSRPDVNEGWEWLSETSSWFEFGEEEKVFDAHLGEPAIRLDGN